jgi:hypothetical protein
VEKNADTIRALVKGLQRNVRPAKVSAVLLDGTVEPLAIGNNKGRWERLTQLLTQLDWAALRCFDANGGLLRLIDNPDCAAADPSDAPPAATVPRPREAELLDSVIRGVEVILREHRSTLTAATSANTEMVRLVLDRLAMLEAHQRDAMEMIREAMEYVQPPAAEPAADGADGIVGQVIAGAVTRMLPKGAPPVAAGGKAP